MGFHRCPHHGLPGNSFIDGRQVTIPIKHQQRCSRFGTAAHHTAAQLLCRIRIHVRRSGIQAKRHAFGHLFQPTRIHCLLNAFFIQQNGKTEQKLMAAQAAGHLDRFLIQDRGRQQQPNTEIVASVKQVRRYSRNHLRHSYQQERRKGVLLCKDYGFLKSLRILRIQNPYILSVSLLLPIVSPHSWRY